MSDGKAEATMAAAEHQKKLLYATLLDFEQATPAEWKLLQSEVRRERTALCEVMARCRGRWAELGELGAVIESIVVRTLIAEPRDWFAQAVAMLDTDRVPYVLLALDVAAQPGVENAPGRYTTKWRSTISRRGAIQALRGLASELEQNPGLLEDGDGVVV